MTNEHAGHRQRLRGQFLKNGPDSLYPHQLLELLLFYAIPQKDTNGLAHSLINRFGSLSAVLDASPEELMSVKGVGRNTAILIKAASEVYAEYGTATQKSIALSNRFILDAYYGNVFRPSDGEQLAVTLLDDGLSVILTKTFGYKSPLLQRSRRKNDNLDCREKRRQPLHRRALPPVGSNAKARRARKRKKAYEGGKGCLPLGRGVFYNERERDNDAEIL